MKNTELAWLAGLLEGEGCFWLRKPRGARQSCSPYLAVSMTDKDVVERVAKIFGVQVKKKPDQRKAHYKPCWTVQASGPRAALWMNRMLPFMGMRRTARINEVLKEWEIPNPFSRAHRGTRRRAVCHPDRAVIAKGLCETCYMRQYRMGGPLRNREPKPWTRKKMTKQALL